MPVSRPNFFSHLHLRWLFILGVGVLPFVVGIGLFRILIAANLNDITPTWSDEIYYWHQANTFRTVGLEGGYYTVNEQPGAVSFMRYYAWGTAVPGVYGLQARFLGWSLYAIPLMNMGLLSAALIIFLWAIRANYAQIFLTGLVILTFIPFLLFSASSMLQVQQQAIAAALATAFYPLLRRPELRDRKIPIWQWGLMLALLVLAALLRATWGILFIPLCVLALRRATILRVIFAIGVGGGVFVLLVMITQAMAAPYSDDTFTEFMGILRATPLVAPRVIFNKVQNNIVALLGGHPIEIHNRLLLLLLLAVMAVVWVQRRYRPANHWLPATPVTQRESLFHLYNVGVVLALNLMLYDVFDWRDYRLLTPPLLLSWLLLVAYRRYRLMAIMIAASLLMLPQIPATYRSLDWYGNHANPHRIKAIENWQDKFAGIITYQPDATSAWCNTALHTPTYLFRFPETLLAIPPGIGISTILNPDRLIFPLKSRYLLLDNEFYQRYADKLYLQPLFPIPNGMLSINLDAKCRE